MRAKFAAHGATLAVVSVDEVADTKKWLEGRGFEAFQMLSDPEQEVIEDRYRLRNPRSPGLAIHAVYIVGKDRRIRYAKVGRRRPRAAELLAVLDGNTPTCCASYCSAAPCR